MSGIALLLAVMASAAIAPARPLDFAARVAVQESLAQIHPRFRAEWLNRRGIELPGYNAPLPAHDRPDSLGLRLVGKWGRGPSVEVTGQDSLIFLALGSEVAIINFANPDSPAILAEVQASGLVVQAAVRDSLLYIGCNGGWAGIEVWNVRNPSAPAFRSRTATMLADFCIRDSFLYLIQNGYGPADTFRVYSTADPVALRPLGYRIDSGYALTVTGSTVLVASNDAIVAIDVSDPATPHRAGAYGGYALGLAARGNICCANIYWSTDYDHFRLEVLDVSDPASMHRLGAIDSVGGWDVHLSGPLAFVSGFQTQEWEFTMVSLLDSASPQVVSTCRTPSNNYAVWADWLSDRAYVADMTGLAVVDITNLNAPTLDTVLLAADLAYDVVVDGDLAYVADFGGGVRILDIADPARPREVGGVDSALSYSRCVVARDSFVFASWQPGPYFRSFQVAEPARPELAGSCVLQSIPQAMVLRDSFAYYAGNRRFQVINVARPRQPVVVGTCNLSGDVGDVLLVDTLAYVTSRYLTAVSITRPDSPRVLHEWNARASGIFVVDTILYMAYYGLRTASIADPLAPYLIDSAVVDDFTRTVVVVDSLAYLGGYTIRVYNVADPADIREVGSWRPPWWVYRLRFAPPYIYAACYNAGVCILDTATLGVTEGGPGATAGPLVRSGATITRGAVALEVPDAGGKEVMLSAYDMAGQLVDCRVLKRQGAVVRYSFAHLPAGVYVLRLRAAERACTFRVVKL